MAATLVTNEWAYRNPTSPLAKLSPDWIATSGSLFQRDGLFWTGVPNAGPTGPDSALMNNSVVFRIVTRVTSHDSVRVAFRLRTIAMAPAGEAWHGVHVFLRYQTPDWLYTATVVRRDAQLVLKKKSAGGYVRLAQTARPAFMGAWEECEVEALNRPDGAVGLSIRINGALLLEAEDRGEDGTPPIATPGRVGLRGDYTEFEFDAFNITPSL